MKLHALDIDDLQVISSHMQDALVRRSDMRYLRKRRQFVFAANRFAWERQPEKIRHRTGLHFEHVLAVRQSGFSTVRGESILSLLSISFSETKAPAGTVTLTFAAGPTLALDVEYLDLAMKDLGPQWTANQRPSHD
jgi:Protein of unknown function (DUF2948)